MPPLPEADDGRPGRGRRIAAALRSATGRGPRSSALLRSPEDGGGEDVARGEAVGIDAAGGEAVEVEVSVGEAVETSDGEAADQAAARGVEHAPAITAEQAAARIDAARARLRATIAAPYDDDDAPGPPAEPE